MFIIYNNILQKLRLYKIIKNYIQGIPGSNKAISLKLSVLEVKCQIYQQKLHEALKTTKEGRLRAEICTTWPRGSSSGAIDPGIRQHRPKAKEMAVAVREEELLNDGQHQGE